MLLPDKTKLSADRLGTAIANRTATVGVIGLGYVGLLLVATIAEAGFPTIGFDIDSEKVKLLNGGTSYIDADLFGPLPADQAQQNGAGGLDHPEQIKDKRESKQILQKDQNADVVEMRAIDADVFEPTDQHRVTADVKHKLNDDRLSLGKPRQVAG